ncbi:MAG: adenylate/guanylate cyclase domain-containing protein, partial [Acidimicrobiales bacterium]|nr:adenylate/guanylate cyclase domain-containing protein [Acidimicrobiales bacterium]
MQWLFGEAWGWRSLDGQSAAGSEANRRNGARFILELNGGMAVLAVIAVALIPLSGASTDGINLPLLFGCVAFGAGVIAPTVWFLPRLAPYWIQVLGLGYEAALTLAAFAIGPRLSSTVVAFYVVEGVCVVTLATRRAAVVHLSAIGIGYAVLLAFQPGNSSPVTRWMIGMGAVIIAGAAVALLVQRMRSLAASLTELNHNLNHRVAEHVEELGRLNRLRRFLSTPVADAVLSADNEEELLRPHRREIAVLFCDLRSFTAFAASSEPEEVHDVLDEYFEVLGGAIRRHKATVGAFTGDGLMAFFNDPLPCPDPAIAA